MTFRNQSNQLLYFVIPFLLVSGIIFWNHWRILRPDAALHTAREYLESQFPGSHWELGRLASVGESLGKKWRLEFSSLQKDGRRIQANLLVDRWMPGKIVGKFILLLSPPKILEGSWKESTFLEQVGKDFSPRIFSLIGMGFLVLQILWLFRVWRRGDFRKMDGLVLVVLGAGLLSALMVTEVPSAFMVVYPLVFTLLGTAVLSREGKENA